MKKISHILLVMLFVFGSVVMCKATPILTSATGNQFNDNYGYTFSIEQDSSNDRIFQAKLTNTSIGGLNSSITYDPMIDALAFNLDANLGADFSIQTIVPDWKISTATGGILFDYAGTANKPGEKLHRNDFLSFEFLFKNSFAFPTNPYDIWLNTAVSSGKGFGGGEDFGQVAVSFQRLGGVSVDKSDLLASNWEGGANPQHVIPEPATMLLLGSGLIGFAVSSKKRLKKRNK